MGKLKIWVDHKNQKFSLNPGDSITVIYRDYRFEDKDLRPCMVEFCLEIPLQGFLYWRTDDDQVIGQFDLLPKGAVVKIDRTLDKIHETYKVVLDSIDLNKPALDDALIKASEDIFG